MLITHQRVADRYFSLICETYSFFQMHGDLYCQFLFINFFFLTIPEIIQQHSSHVIPVSPITVFCQMQENLVHEGAIESLHYLCLVLYSSILCSLLILFLHSITSVSNFQRTDFLLKRFRLQRTHSIHSTPQIIKYFSTFIHSANIQDFYYVPRIVKS